MDKAATPYSKTAPLVFAVVVNWNSRTNLLECLDSLEKVDYPRSNLEILVVDNGSTDGSKRGLDREHPRVTLLENRDNLGYVKAANRGIEFALARGADYVWILNNDVVVDRDSLSNMVDAGESQESIGVIGPVVYKYFDPENAENCGYRVDFWTGRLKKLRFGKDVFSSRARHLEDVESNMGCSNLVKSKVFERIGLLNPAYEIYFEETDFNVRARRDGFRVVVVREARVWHKVAATMNNFIFRRAYLLLRNLLVFQYLNARPWHLVVFIPYFFLLHIPYFLIYGSIYGMKIRLPKFRA